MKEEQKLYLKGYYKPHLETIKSAGCVFDKEKKQYYTQAPHIYNELQKLLDEGRAVERTQSLGSIKPPPPKVNYCHKCGAPADITISRDWRPPYPRLPEEQWKYWCSTCMYDHEQMAKEYRNRRGTC